MKLAMVVKNLIVHVDPLDHWPGITPEPEQVILSMGFLTMYVGVSFQEHADDVAEAVVQMYGMGSWSTDTEGTFTEDGVKTYPGDPDQYPLLAIMPLEKDQKEASNVEVIYMYEHEWVMFRFKDGTYKHLRMD